ncbi:MAG: hypothetical protein RIT04_557 [Candidatus Parcubacteria bacterium]|jgi:hypothetical protein
MENMVEKAPERILSKEEVLEAIRYYAENAEAARELSDEQGLYLFEAKIAGEKPGETTQFEYMRKGVFSNQNETSETVIHKVYYENEIPVGGEQVAFYRYETEEWVHV